MSDQDKSSGTPTPNWGLSSADETSGRPEDRAIPLGPSPLAADAPGPVPAASSGAPGFRFPEPPGSRAVEEDRTAGATVEEPSWSRAADPVEQSYPSGFFEPEDDGEAFERPGAEKLGIIGGKGVGKSFLFQAMVYRTYAKKQAGAMSQFLDKTHLFYALQREDKGLQVSLGKFGKKYRSWDRLPQTIYANQSWYRLRLHYRTGIFGRQQSTMDVEFFDGSGEGFEAPRTRHLGKIWRDSFLGARVMVFCLPLWAAFPGSGMTTEDRERRRLILDGFEEVIQNYGKLRQEGDRTQQRVRSILAFTMADDPRSALSTLYQKWISPYMDSPQLYLPRLATESGIARYLANARRVSDFLHDELAGIREPRVNAIPQMLDFGSRPWLIPVSAVEGKLLDRIERQKDKGLPSDERLDPVPVHVELPLLVALCERHNALM